jgi:hypothetical protein
MMVLRVVRVPVFVFNLLVGTSLVCFFLAWVSVGDWCEGGLHRLGYQERPHWLPGVLGILVYLGLGIVGPAYLGYYLVGWPGAIIGPLCTLVMIAILGRW